VTLARSIVPSAYLLSLRKGVKGEFHFIFTSCIADGHGRKGKREGERGDRKGQGGGREGEGLGIVPENLCMHACMQVCARLHGCLCARARHEAHLSARVHSCTSARGRTLTSTQTDMFTRMCQCMRV